jgi:hypothetical protein
MKKGWPDYVYVLTSHDICIEDYEDGDKKHLVEWIRFHFGNDAMERFREVHTLCKEVIGIDFFDIVEEWSDKHSKTESAEAFNKTMRELGYTEYSYIMEASPSDETK